MSGENSIVRLNGKNYPSWEFQFRMFVKGKELGGHVDGSSKAPTDSTELSSWESKDAKIASWLLSSVEPHMVNSLRSYTTSKEMWDYLRPVYHQDNTAQKFQLELEIANYKLGNLSIDQFYAGFLNLWSEYSGIVYSKIPKEALAALQVIHAESQRDQFLMKLRPEFETARAGLLNRTPVPSSDVCLGELLREEQRLATQLGITQGSVTTEMVSMAYAAQGKGKSKAQIQCYSRKEFGHIAKNCSKKFCNYCKKEGHFIKECPVRPQNRRGQGFKTAVHTNAAAISYAPAPGQQCTPGSSSALTPEMVQQMIISAFSTFGLQGKGNLLTSPCLVDSAASNHMTCSTEALHDVRKYTGDQHMQIANGSNLPITAIGNLGSSFTNVFVSPELSTILLSVGQLVNNNCEIHFGRNGCCVQDQASGKVIPRGLKWNVYFLFSFPFLILIPLVVLLLLMIALFGIRNWDIPILVFYLMKHGYLGNKDSFSTVSSECNSCKLGKSKFLPFPSHGSRASTCFEIIRTDVGGVSPILSHAQYKYFVTFIDDYSCFTWVYFLRSKADVFSTFQAFVVTQFSACIKILRSHSGGEYMSPEFQEYLKTKGILSQRSCPYTPQQNGVAEYKNRHLLDVVRSLLIESSVPPRF